MPRSGKRGWPGPRPRRAQFGTRPERRLHGNNRRGPHIVSTPAPRGQAQNPTAATLSQIKFFHRMWTNLFAVAGTREHPPAGVIRKRGRSAPSCVPAAHSREYAVRNKQHGKFAPAAQTKGKRAAESWPRPASLAAARQFTLSRPYSINYKCPLRPAAGLVCNFAARCGILFHHIHRMERRLRTWSDASCRPSAPS